MREIKFRAWDIQFKRMKVTGMGINGGILDGEDVVIMQFTGLHDKKGKEIYEGDILEYHSGMVPRGSNPIIRAVATWNPRTAQFVDCFIGEVIGNIYENPELVG